ncbi:MAG: Uma2 family endonuclease [Spirulina sp. SIO3F2]|nr:Uma2 family endonuclease [Spirulina sp. SIO3F2]
MIANPQYLNPEDYLELEAESSIKHEYINGRVFAMAGSTDTHNVIIGNLFVEIRSHLRGSGCQTYFTDIKARLEERNRYYYPDLLVTCDPRDQETSTYKRFSKLIIEVLSDSTEAFDRGDKFLDYQTLPSLEEYVLVNTKQQRVEIFRRAERGLWLLQSYYPPEPIELQSLDLRVEFAELYADVVLEDVTSETELEN